MSVSSVDTASPAYRAVGEELQAANRRTASETTAASASSQVHPVDTANLPTQRSLDITA